MSLIPIEVSQINESHPARLLYGYWQAHKDADGMLSRSSFDPISIAEVMRWVMILERLGPLAAAQYRYRLCGSGCAEVTEYDYTGRLLGDGIDAQAARDRRREFFQVLTRHRPAFSITQLPVEGREFIKVCRAVFPVRDADGGDQLFVVLAPVGTTCRMPGGGAPASGLAAAPARASVAR